MAEPRLEVYSNKSVLVDAKGESHIFAEGKQTDGAKKRLSEVKKELRRGYLQRIIDGVIEKKQTLVSQNETTSAHLNGLVNAVTSEYGRALIGLTVLQLTIKAITPDQNIRLHKASNTSGSSFSWSDGMPMRSLDKEYITPVLRSNELLKLNADGFMMTRTLAENYPYSKLYKAAIKGGKNHWLELVDMIELGEIDPAETLRHLIALLINRSASFQEAANSTLVATEKAMKKNKSAKKVRAIVKKFVSDTDYSARAFEIAMHSLMQALEEFNVLEGTLRPLSQMRSANKKHGNVGDVEIVEVRGSDLVIEAWDAKYGKPYLRDELEELDDKLEHHPETKIAGFVVDRQPLLKKDVVERLEELRDVHGIQIDILSFDEWIDRQLRKYSLDEDKLMKRWLKALAETVCQKRRDKAPIDEPCDKWVEDLGTLLKTKFR